MRIDVHAFLVDCAKKRRTTSYEEIAEKFNIFTAKVGEVTGEISIYEILNGRPVLSAIVLNNTGYPGGGFFGLPNLPKSVHRPPSQWKNQELTGREKRFVENEQRRVWKFWKNVVPCYIPEG